MKNLFAVTAIGLLLSSTAFAEDKAPDIRIIDNKVSVQAESVPLARLLRLFGEAAGIDSKVPPELANRNISVRFSNLSVPDAVQKIFEGQPFDYFLVEGKTITVTGLSQVSGAAPRTAGAPAPSPQQETVFVDDNPAFSQPQPPINANPPAMIQTPFGAIPNPNARQQAQQNGFPGAQQQAVPMLAPGQYPNGLPGQVPNNQSVIQTPFGTITNPNGLPTMNNGLPGMQPNSPFGQQPTTISPGVTPGAPTGFPGSPVQGNPFPQNPRPNP